MKASTLVIALTLTAAASMSGCATDSMLEPVLQRRTAIAVGGNAVAPEQVRISDEQGFGLDAKSVVHWHASAPTGEFDCSALRGGQDGLTETVCVKK